MVKRLRQEGRAFIALCKLRWEHAGQGNGIFYCSNDHKGAVSIDLEVTDKLQKVDKFKDREFMDNEH